MIPALIGLGAFLVHGIPNVLQVITNVFDQYHERKTLEMRLEKLEQMRAIDDKERGDASMYNNDTSVILADLSTSVVKSGVPWVDSLNASVRPFCAYTILFLYMYHKFINAFWFVVNGGSFADIPDFMIYGDTDVSIFLLIIGFYFGGRHFGRK